MVDTWEGDVEVVYEPSGQRERIRGRVVVEDGKAKAWEEDVPGFWLRPSNEPRRIAILDAALRSTMRRSGDMDTLVRAASQGLANGGDPGDILRQLIRASIGRAVEEVPRG